MGNRDRILVVGATVLYDFIFKVDRLPQPGQVATIIAPDEPETMPYFGGTAFNISIGLAKLGEQVSLVHPVGKDFYGSAYQTLLEEHKINLDGLMVNSSSQCGYAYVFFTEEGATLCFSSPTQLPNGSVPPSAFEDVELVVLTPVFGPLHEQVISHTVDLSLPLAIVGIAEEWIIDLLPQVAMLTLNHHEIELLSKLARSLSPKEMTGEMPGVIFETKGERGCTIYGRGMKPGDVRAIQPQEIVDTTGAGDAFAAAALASLLQGFDPIEAAWIGATAASYVVEAFGCQTNLPGWVQIAERLRYSQPDISDQILKGLP